MVKLYFMRHGESHVNIEDQFGSAVGAPNDKGLTSTGRAHARLAGQKALEVGLKPDLIICSPLLRARETAIIVANEIRYPTENIVYSELFVEIQFGELEGSSWNEYWNSGKTYADFHKYKGAETIESLQKRAEKALRFCKYRSEPIILVVSHSAFGRALRRSIENRPYTDEFTNIHALPHAEILHYI